MTRRHQQLETISPGLADRVEQHLRGWADHLRFNTYLTCVSVHVDGEDKNGRLSMWRAYGGSNGVALVLKNTAFVAETNVLAAYTSPVLYATAEQFSEPFSQLVCSVEAAQAFLKAQGSSTVLNYLLAAMRFAVLSTKHPGFSEEQEWRIIHSPSIDPSNHLKPHLEIVNGVPQRVYKIELRDYSSEGLNGMQLSELLDRVIIGPTQYPMVMFDAFMRALDESGVQNSEHKISISGIPLRRT